MGPEALIAGRTLPSLRSHLRIKDETMTFGAGLLGCYGQPLAPDRIEEALRRAPWRGAPTTKIDRPFGTIIALGSADAALHKHVAIVVHGRIDNLPEIARDLDVAPTDTCSVLAETYLRYGDGFAGHLLGDFAILLLDEHRHILLAARDWIGARPRFWARNGHDTAFGSEIKQVLALLDRPYVLNEETAASYEAFEGPPTADTTFAEGVKAIMPSSQAVVGVGSSPRITERQVRFDPVDCTLSEAANAIRVHLDRAVERRLHGAARPSAEISGGMDSTSVAACAAALAEQGRVAPLVAGLTLHFPEAMEADETVYARAVAAKWGVPFHPVEIQPSELRTGLPELLSIHDGPVFPGIHFADRVLAEACRLRSDVLLTGHLGDNWQSQFGGEIECAVLRSAWPTALYWFGQGLRRAPRRAIRQGLRATKMKLSGRREGELFAGGVVSFWNRMALEGRERHGQHYGIRVEVPFADRELAGLLVGLSPTIRSSTGGDKLPLRAAMHDRLPTSVLQRMEKAVLDAVFVAAFDLSDDLPNRFSPVAAYYLEQWRRTICANGGAVGVYPSQVTLDKPLLLPHSTGGPTG
jgi:asparagine synthase (glutamine-hydrolysing)